jgi:hypothetical protein
MHAAGSWIAFANDGLGQMSKLGGLKDRWPGRSKTALSHEPAQPRAEHCSPERLAHLSDLDEPARPGPATVYRSDEGQPTPVVGLPLTSDVLASPSADPSVVPVPEDAVPASKREVPVAPVPEPVFNREVPEPVVPDVVVPDVVVPEVAVPPRSVSQAGRHRRPPSPKRIVPRVFGLTVRRAAVLGFLTLLAVLGLFVVLT